MKNYGQIFQIAAIVKSAKFSDHCKLKLKISLHTRFDFHNEDLGKHFKKHGHKADLSAGNIGYTEIGKSVTLWKIGLAIKIIRQLIFNALPLS
ncbi:hypothetical protein [Membranihabitans marinus]|uniref:hypothetical protein n=1 Tax=Membranihabitans marinus TaxID=1227546 RepID=UPI001F42DDBC|nr:hypothetical protein [Membranihabitans marinus]